MSFRITKESIMLRNRKLASVCITLFVLICSKGLAKYSGGQGTEQSPYIIAGKQDLMELSRSPADYGGCFQLSADINLSGERFEKAVIAPDNRIMGEEFDGNEFTGTFDGNSHKITNLEINGSANDFLGLFGGIGRRGKVFDLSVTDAKIEGGRSGCHGILCGGLMGGTVKGCETSGTVSCKGGSTGIGGLCGANESGLIEGCTSYATVSSGGGHIGVGGLCGGNFGGRIRDSCSGGLMKLASGCSQVGGFCGINENGTVERCLSTSSITAGGQTKYAGGFCGGNMKGRIENCFSIGNLRAGRESVCLGGFCGAAIEGHIKHCYSTGSAVAAKPNRYLGGFCGANNGGSITGCFWDAQRSGMGSSDGGWGLPSSKLKQRGPWVSAGWDVAELGASQTGIWNCSGNGYPMLRVLAEMRKGK